MIAHGEAHAPAGAVLTGRADHEAARIGPAITGGENTLAFDKAGVLGQVSEAGGFPVLAIHDGAHAADFAQNRQAAGIIADEQDARGTLAQMDDPADQAAFIDGHCAGLDALQLTGIGQEGLREGPVDLGGDAGGDPLLRGLAHQVEDALIGFQPVCHGNGGSLVAGEVTHFVFKFADPAFPLGLAGDARPEADLARRTQAVADRGARGHEEFGNLRCRLGHDQRKGDRHEDAEHKPACPAGRSSLT